VVSGQWSAAPEQRPAASDKPQAESKKDSCLSHKGLPTIRKTLHIRHANLCAISSFIPASYLILWELFHGDENALSNYGIGANFSPRAIKED
jgi:hypothetical protein